MDPEIAQETTHYHGQGWWLYREIFNTEMVFVCSEETVHVPTVPTVYYTMPVPEHVVERYTYVPGTFKEHIPEPIVPKACTCETGVIQPVVLETVETEVEDTHKEYMEVKVTGILDKDGNVTSAMVKVPLVDADLLCEIPDPGPRPKPWEGREHAPEYYEMTQTMSFESSCATGECTDVAVYSGWSALKNVLESNKPKPVKRVTPRKKTEREWKESLEELKDFEVPVKRIMGNVNKNKLKKSRLSLPKKKKKEPVQINRMKKLSQFELYQQGAPTHAMGIFVDGQSKTLDGEFHTYRQNFGETANGWIKKKGTLDWVRIPDSEWRDGQWQYKVGEQQSLPIMDTVGVEWGVDSEEVLFGGFIE